MKLNYAIIYPYIPITVSIAFLVIYCLRRVRNCDLNGMFLAFAALFYFQTEFIIYDIPTIFEMIMIIHVWVCLYPEKQ